MIIAGTVGASAVTEADVDDAYKLGQWIGDLACQCGEKRRTMNSYSTEIDAIKAATEMGRWHVCRLFK